MTNHSTLHTSYTSPTHIPPAHLPVLTSCLAVWAGAQGDPVRDVMLVSWGSVHLPPCHHWHHWAGVGDTEEDWKQTHCGPWQVSQLVGIIIPFLHADSLYSHLYVYMCPCYPYTLIHTHTHTNTRKHTHTLASHAVILWAGVGCSVLSSMPLNAARQRALWMCSRWWRHSASRNQAVCLLW